MAVTVHPNYATLANRTNTLVSRAITAQGIYLGNYGYFFQGIAIPPTVPDGVMEVDVDTSVTPTDQIHSWVDFDPVGYAALSKKRMRVRIDVYEAPLGDGWIIQIEFKYAGIGPDPYGTDGDHWVYRYHDGDGNPGGIFEVWYIQVDGEV